MSRELAIAAFVAILAAEVLYRISEVWERAGRAVRACRCGTCAR